MSFPHPRTVSGSKIPQKDFRSYTRQATSHCYRLTWLTSQTHPLSFFPVASVQLLPFSTASAPWPSFLFLAPWCVLISFLWLQWTALANVWGEEVHSGSQLRVIVYNCGNSRHDLKAARRVTSLAKSRERTNGPMLAYVCSASYLFIPSRTQTQGMTLPTFRVGLPLMKALRKSLSPACLLANLIVLATFLLS